jgi:hypothetical protein
MDSFRITSKKVLTLVMVLDKDQQKVLHTSLDLYRPDKEPPLTSSPNVLNRSCLDTRSAALAHISGMGIPNTASLPSRENTNHHIISNHDPLFLPSSFGGKVEPGETPSQGALRELEEEAGITAKPEGFKKAGLLLFLFENDPVGLETHVYKAESYEGQIRE